MMAMDDLEFRIARLALRPGDILVLKPRRPLSKTARDHIKQCFKRVAPGAKCLVLQDGMELAILTREEIERGAA
jgi:hypothetical protein